MGKSLLENKDVKSIVVLILTKPVKPWQPKCLNDNLPLKDFVLTGMIGTKSYNKIFVLKNSL